MGGFIKLKIYIYILFVFLKRKILVNIPFSFPLFLSTGGPTIQGINKLNIINNLILIFHLEDLKYNNYSVKIYGSKLAKRKDYSTKLR